MKAELSVHLEDVLYFCCARQPVLSLNLCSRKSHFPPDSALLPLVFFIHLWIMSLLPDVSISFPVRSK